MDEVELIDKALEGCYGLQNRIATLLAKLNDINMEKGISLSAKDSLAKRSKKSSKNRKKKDKKKALKDKESTENFTNFRTEDTTKLDEDLKRSQTDTSSTESEVMFTSFSDIFVEANADDYLKRYDLKNLQSKRVKRSKYNRSLKLSKEECAGEESAILATLTDIIVQVNAENSSNVSNSKPSRSSRNKKSKDKNRKAPTSNPVDKSKTWSSNLVANVLTQIEKQSHAIDQLKHQYSYCSSDIESDDSGFSSSLRSLQEINSAYAKIDKRFIEVKRSVESVFVGMKHVDEIINRQKGVFHINFGCAENETFICRH